MGLPIRTIVCATNANDVVHRTLTYGDMAQRASRPSAPFEMQRALHDFDEHFF